MFVMLYAMLSVGFLAPVLSLTEIVRWMAEMGLEFMLNLPVSHDDGPSLRDWECLSID